MIIGDEQAENFTEDNIAPFCVYTGAAVDGYPWCYALGRHIRRFLDTRSGRVAVVASSSWSHSFLAHKFQCRAMLFSAHLIQCRTFRMTDHLGVFGAASLPKIQ
jgi:hypothetical protein